MKKTKVIVFISLLLTAISAMAQVPQAIKYQAITRDVNGSILANQAIKMRISLLANNANGSTLYAETHAVTTNAYGLVNLEIGNGEVMEGNFTAIDWSKGDFFVKIEADENGGDNFQALGSSQLLSVPFAMYANSAGIRHMTDDQRDSIAEPLEGTMIYNVSSQCLNVRRQGNWFELCGDCVPQPSLPHAGQDAYSPVDTMVQLSANIPVKGSGSWAVISGNGGYFSDVNDPHATFYGIANHLYKLGWRISTNCKTLVDTINISLNQVIITGFNCGDSIIHAGKLYHTAQIGPRCWMQENLDVGVMVNGDQDQIDNGIIEKYCFDNDPAYCDVYGGLYQWNEIMNYENAAGATGICPTGMHIPTLDDWNSLIAAYGGAPAAGGAMKAEGLTHWATPNNDATNTSGFTALGSGYRHNNGIFVSILSNACYWGSNVNTLDKAAYFYLRNTDGGISQSYFEKSFGFAVRCVLD